MRKAYSYIRYSSPKQMWGDSYRRQFELTKEYCEKNNLLLVDHYKDLGVSGYKSKTGAESTDQIALQKLLDDIKTGKIEQGSVLIVESLDRLSRENVRKAMHKLLEILDYIDIYTLTDRKLYKCTDDSESVSIDLILSITIMLRAHDESRTKSLRLQQSWDQKRKNIETKKLTPNCPFWLKLDKESNTFIVDQGKANSVRKIYSLCIEGEGITSIVKYLNAHLEEHIPPRRRRRVASSSLDEPRLLKPTEHWAKTTVSKLLSDKSVLGEYQPHIGNSQNRQPIGDPIKDYYPKIIDPEVFFSAQVKKQQRKVGKGRKSKEFSNLFRGFLKCDSCKSSMEYTNKGKPPKGGRYLVCSKAKRGGGCSNNRHYRYEPLEIALLRALSVNEVLHELNTDIDNELNKVIALKAEANEELNNFLYAEPNFSIPSVLEHFQKLQKNLQNLIDEESKLIRKNNKDNPDFTFDTLIRETLLEKDQNERYKNRESLNSYLQNIIEAGRLSYYDDSILIFLYLPDHDTFIKRGEAFKEPEEACVDYGNLVSEDFEVFDCVLGIEMAISNNYKELEVSTSSLTHDGLVYFDLSPPLP